MDVVNCRRLAAATILLLAQHGAGALPVLLEVYYDAPGSDASSAFTEIAGTAGFSLTGYSLVGINGGTGDAYRTIALDGAAIPADGILVLATASASGDTLAVRDLIASVDWQNGPDAVALLDPAGAIIDALQYGASAGFSAGEGRNAADAAAGESLSRDVYATDTDDNASDFSAGAPTPGRGFLVPTPLPIVVPEPASLLLVAMALTMLLRTRRRRPQPSGAGSRDAPGVVPWCSRQRRCTRPAFVAD